MSLSLSLFRDDNPSTANPLLRLSKFGQILISDPQFVPPESSRRIYGIDQPVPFPSITRPTPNRASTHDE